MSPSCPVAIFCAILLGCGGRSASYGDDAEGDPSAGAPSTPESGGSGGSAPTDTGGTGAGNEGGSNNGGSTTNGGSATNGGSGGTAGSRDANCYPGLAESGAECTENCTIPCGLGELGERSCQCTGGYYSSCHCPRPPGYLGAPTAPPCDTPDGRAIPLRNLPCDVEWAQCIGNDPVEGSIPRGCACLKNPLNGDRLQWFCGSTSRWFFPE